MLQEIDAKWQKRWEEAKLFAPSAKNGEKFYLTAAFPYPNSPQHIGHGRTYSTTDIYARYMRMRGKNVLFPMGFHVTGTPILAMAKRIADKDEELLVIFEKIYGISRETAAGLTDPRELVAYFSREIEAGMKEMGYSIDWRRKFYSYDKQFNRFVEWQFEKLHKMGLITKGEHAVPWCPVSNGAVGAHDTRGEMDPQIEEVVGVLFAFEDGFLACSTYRPETIYGATNLWVNSSALYVKAEWRGKKLYIAKDALAPLSMQLDLKVKEEVAGGKLVGRMATNPVSGEKVPVLAASFVDAAHGTGVVMSVPAHAPFDYLALRQGGHEGKLKLRQVLRVEGFGEFPAKERVERMKSAGQNDPKAQLATEEIYKKEAHSGVMVEGEFAGMKGIEAKEKVKGKLVDEGHAIILYEISNGPIYSRYGGLVGVRVVKDQWFIDYGSKEWKEKARKCLEAMEILPEKTRREYEHTIEWLHEKACTRSAGLGTVFPFDKGKMIEALSDSTLYMAFYTVAHLAMKMKPEELDEKLFDFVFLGKGKAEGLPAEAAAMREEFEYWYPLDSRHSATDLVHNHLTYFVFNHVAILPQKHWPKRMVTNGFVLMDGKKMSKSMGNIMPIRAACKELGADTIRFTVVSGADLSQDSDFNRPAVSGVISRLNMMMAAMGKHAGKKDGPKRGMAEKLLLSRLHRRCLAAPPMYESFQLRELALELFYNTTNDVQWYLKTSEKPQMREFFEHWVALIAPFMPHVAEEMWEKLGKKHYVKDAEFVSVAPFPKGDAKKVDEALEAAQSYVQQVKEDISSILRLIRMEKPSKIELFVASEWKRKLREIAAREKKFDTAMKVAMGEPGIKKHAADVAKVLMAYMKNPGALEKEISSEFELEALKSAGKMLSEEFGAPFSFEMEEKSSSPKAKHAMPGKPSILIS